MPAAPKRERFRRHWSDPLTQSEDLTDIVNRVQAKNERRGAKTYFTFGSARNFITLLDQDFPEHGMKLTTGEIGPLLPVLKQHFPREKHVDFIRFAVVHWDEVAESYRAWRASQPPSTKNRLLPDKPSLSVLAYRVKVFLVYLNRHPEFGL